MRVRLAPLLAAAALLVGTATARGQSLQKFSVQGSGAVLFPDAVDPSYQSATKLGFEAQIRYTHSRWSVGVGYQRSTVYKIVTGSGDVSVSLSLIFVEPRYVITSTGGVAFYAAARVGVGSNICNPSTDCKDDVTRSNASFGGGGGMLLKVAPGVALDLGAQYFRVSNSFNAGFTMLRLGFGIGL